MSTFTQQGKGYFLMEEQQSAQPELSLTDLHNLRSIVDTASRRGAFHASEMSAVGTVFDKLNNFLNAVKPAASQEEPTQE